MTPIVRVSAQTEWNLQVTNIENKSVTYTYDQLLAMPETTVNASEYCGYACIARGFWGGVSLSYLLQQVGLDPSVASVDFQASDGYAVTIPLQMAMQSGTITAYELNGSPLLNILCLVFPEDPAGNIWIYRITSITMSTAIAQYPSVGGEGAAVAGIVGAEPSSAPPGQSSTQSQGSEGLGFPSMALYAIAVAATVALVTVGYTTYKHKRISGAASLSQG